MWFLNAILSIAFLSNGSACLLSYILPPRVCFPFQAFSKEKSHNQGNRPNYEPPGVPMLLCGRHDLGVTQFSLKRSCKSTVPFFHLRPIPAMQKVKDFVRIVLTHVVLEPAFGALSRGRKDRRQLFLLGRFSIFTCGSLSHESNAYSVVNFPEPHGEFSPLFRLYLWRCP